MDWEAIGAVGNWVAAIGAVAVFAYAVQNDLWRSPRADSSLRRRPGREGADQHGRRGLTRRRPRTGYGSGSRTLTGGGSLGTARLTSSASRIGDRAARPATSSRTTSANWCGCTTAATHRRRPDLLPGVEHRVDVVAAVDMLPLPPKGRNAVATTPVPENVLSVRRRFPPWPLEETGDHIFTVQVSAEDANAAVIKVRVHWDGNRRSLRGEQVGTTVYS